MLVDGGAPTKTCGYVTIVELSDSDRALVAAFDLSESRRPANEAAGRVGTSDASVEEGAREFGIGFER